jgi:hypothetical protein
MIVAAMKIATWAAHIRIFLTSRNFPREIFSVFALYLQNKEPM